jgi:hypothetical protein
MSKQRYDERGNPVNRGLSTDAWALRNQPLSREEQKQLGDQKRTLCALARNRTTLVGGYEFGRFCLDAEATGLWRRDKRTEPGGFAMFAAQTIGQISRGTIDRRMQVALVFSLETVTLCQQKGVSFGGLVAIAGADWRTRSSLIGLALSGAPLRALMFVRRALETRPLKSADATELRTFVAQQYKAWLHLEASPPAGAEPGAPAQM